MAGETQITIVGNLVDDVELRFTPNGVAVAKFRIASTPRTFNKTTNAWEDGEALFLTCSVWRQAAEHVAESLARGVRVIVQGRLRQRSYEDKEQVKRTVYELDVDEVGPSLTFATAKVTKAGGGQRQGGAPNADPWAGAKPANSQQQGGGWGSQPAGQQPAGHTEEPPF